MLLIRSLFFRRNTGDQVGRDLHGLDERHALGTGSENAGLQEISPVAKQKLFYCLWYGSCQQGDERFISCPLREKLLLRVRERLQPAPDWIRLR